MAIIQTVTGYVTSKGVQETTVAGKQVYKISLRVSIRPRKDETRTVIATADFWGAYNSYLQKYIAPYDQITLTGELKGIDILAPREGQVDGLIMMNLAGLHCNLPKRDDSDGTNKSKITKQKREALKPDPVEEDEDIPF